jgi:hypothetical protein
MGNKALEDSIRGYPIDKLEEVIGTRRKYYSDEAIEIAEDELLCRKLNSLNPIEQIDFIKSLSRDQIDSLAKKSHTRFPPSVMNIIQTECSKRGMEESEWYYLDNNNPIGPIKLSELKKLAEYGSILPNSLVFKQGTQNWLNASNVPGIFGFGNTNIPPPPLMYPNQPIYNQNAERQEAKESTDLGCGMSLLCFLIPIIGLILFFTEKNEKGRNALALAFIGFIIGIVLYMVFFPVVWFY